MMNTRTISISICRPPQQVYEYASNPENLPQWAPGFVKSIALRDGAWIAATTIGEVEFRFAPRNDYGVLDHQVTLPTGQVFSNPMRVIANGEKASEVIFTLFQHDGVSDAQFAADETTVLNDLQRLKAVLETFAHGSKHA